MIQSYTCNWVKYLSIYICTVGYIGDIHIRNIIDWYSLRFHQTWLPKNPPCISNCPVIFLGFFIQYSTLTIFQSNERRRYIYIYVYIYIYTMCVYVRVCIYNIQAMKDKTPNISSDRWILPWSRRRAWTEGRSRQRNQSPGDPFRRWIEGFVAYSNPKNIEPWNIINRYCWITI